MPGTAVGSSPGATLPAPTGAGTTPGSSPASSGTMGGAASGSSQNPATESIPVKFAFKPGDEHLLQMDYGNGLFKFYVGGRLQIDAAWVRTTDDVQASRTAGGIGKLDDAVNFRRGRFDFGGTFYKNIDFLMEWDFINTFNAERTGSTLAANTPVPTDMWVTFKEVPWVGNVRIGNQKPPISFEHMTSSRFLNFMERSLGFDAFIENQNNGFEMGICAFDTYMDERGTWALGVFKNTRSIFGWNVGDGEYDVTGRVTYLPVYEDDGATLVHVGLGASHRDFDDDVDRVRARTLIRNGPAVLHNIVAEAIVGGKSRDLVNPEFVVVYGPWTFQSEYQRAWFRDAVVPATGPGPRLNLGTVQMQAGYAELLYFLTGEHRYYNRKSAAFGRVTPNESFRGFGMTDDGCDGCDGCGGGGAWQIGARYSWIDLDNNGVQGGTIHDVTLGLNWFLNPYMKWQWNAEALYRNFAPNAVRDGWVYGFGTRIAIDF
jgi:phosphate-selective porin OprO and OprP